MLWVAGSCLSSEQNRATVQAMLAARDRIGWTVLDLDYRPVLWPSERAARSAMSDVLSQATVAVGNQKECEVAVGCKDPDRAADALLERGIDLAIVKLGANGVLVATRETRETFSAVPVDVVCGLGAGDAFGGALCHRLLAGDSLGGAVRFASAAGAIVASRLLCASAMPSASEVEAALAGQALAAPTSTNKKSPRHR